MESTKLPNFRIDLDLPGDLRWKEVISQYSKNWKILVEEMWTSFEETIDDNAISFANIFAETTLKFLKANSCSDIADELISMAKYGGISIGEACLLNLSYETVDMNTGCSCVVAFDKNEIPWLGRTLDWDMEKLKPLTISIDFYRNKILVYRATTWAGYLGIMTGMKPFEYSLAVNYRHKEQDDSQSETYRWPVGFLTRHALDKMTNYDSCVKFLSEAPIMAPAYFILTGISNRKATIIIRYESPNKPATIVQSNISQKNSSQYSFTLPFENLVFDGNFSPHFFVQANSDYWSCKCLDDSIERIELICSMMKKYFQSRKNKHKSMFDSKNVREHITDVLSHFPIWEDKISLYMTLMCPKLDYYENYMKPCKKRRKENERKLVERLEEENGIN